MHTTEVKHTNAEAMTLLKVQVAIAVDNLHKFEGSTHPNCKECLDMIAYWNGKLNALTYAVSVIRGMA